MPRSLEILHLTDPHLLAVPGARLHGWDVAAAFRAVWQRAQADHRAADALVLGGDLVDDESLAGYRWLDDQIADGPDAVLAVAGNHDDSPRMAQALGRAAVHRSIALGAWTLIGLDSRIPGQTAGRIGPAALDRLAAQLSRSPGPCLIVLHHPPIAVGTPWIDAMGLQDAHALAECIAAHPQVAGLLCGHVHQAARGVFAGRPVWTTPATMRQFAPGAQTFAEDRHRVPGYRRLRLDPDGGIETSVHRVPEARDAAAH